MISRPITVGDTSEFRVAKGIVMGMLDQLRVGNSGEEALCWRGRAGCCVMGFQRRVQVLFVTYDKYISVGYISEVEYHTNEPLCVCEREKTGLGTLTGAPWWRKVREMEERDETRRVGLNSAVDICLYAIRERV